MFFFPSPPPFFFFKKTTCGLKLSTVLFFPFMGMGEEIYFLIAGMHIIEGGWSVFICTEVFTSGIWSEGGKWPVLFLSASLVINKQFENDE